MENEPTMGTEIFAVAGNPVLHSRSPQLMNCAFESLGIDAVYTRMLAGSGEEAVRTAKEIGLGGLNITSPFKGEVIEHLDEVSTQARKLGAVNTIVFEGDSASGHNTDYLGAIGALENASIGIRGKKAVVLGAGGAGRAAAFGLHSEGAKATLLNRDAQKAQEAADAIGCAFGGMGTLAEELLDSDIVVSCLPRGLNLIEAQMPKEGAVLMDANYGESPLAGIAQKANCTFIDGREWLLAQAAPSFELFVSKIAPIEAMREAVYADLPEEGVWKGTGNIALIGFMGVGKSAVARELSVESGKELTDVDLEIEKRAGASIKHIFSEFGEDEFRSMEREEIARVGQARNKVIDCGGGAVLDEGNVEILRKSSVPVWLWARPETALSRLGEESGRPLLDVEDRMGLARKLSSGRRGKYAKTAQMIISSEGRSAAEVAGMILHETGKSI